MKKDLMVEKGFQVGTPATPHASTFFLQLQMIHTTTATETEFFCVVVTLTQLQFCRQQP